MSQRYPALNMVASLLKTISVIFIIVGLGASFWFLFQGEPDNTTRLIAIAGIMLSIVFGIIIYALSDFFRCIMDIENNTHPKANTIPPSTQSFTGSSNRKEQKASLLLEYGDVFVSLITPVSSSGHS